MCGRTEERGEGEGEGGGGGTERASFSPLSPEADRWDLSDRRCSGAVSAFRSLRWLRGGDCTRRSEDFWGGVVDLLLLGDSLFELVLLGVVCPGESIFGTLAGFHRFFKNAQSFTHFQCIDGQAFNSVRENIEFAQQEVILH